MQIEYDDSAHTYKLNGRPVPSVTQVIRLAGLMDTTWFTPESAQLGQHVAKATEYDDAGKLDENSLDPAIRPYLDAWRMFRSESGCQIVAAEMVVGNEVHSYAGILDRIVTMSGDSWIIDIKTGQRSEWHSVQTAGYAMCFAAKFRRGCVYLGPNGRYRLVAHHDARDQATFMAALAVAHWKRERGLA